MALRRLLSLLLSALPVLAAAQTLTVSAAQSLAEPMREIGARFEAARPGAKLRYNFAASGVLLQQIVQGAPVDVFVSADQETMARGVEQKVLDAVTQRSLASNTLVLVAPAEDGQALRALGDLARPEVRRIAIGKTATTPAGRYARQTLESAGLWTALEPRLVFADNVRQVLDYVARGEAEAGFVYRTDAELSRGRVRLVLTAAGHVPIAYPAAVVADSRHPGLAREFHAFLFQPEAQAILARHGFGRP